MEGLPFIAMFIFLWFFLFVFSVYLDFLGGRLEGFFRRHVKSFILLVQKHCSSQFVKVLLVFGNEINKRCRYVV